MKRRLTVLFISSFFALSCGDLPQETPTPDTQTEPDVELPQGMLIRPHIQWIEWTVPERRQYVDMSYPEVMRVDPELAAELAQKNVDRDDILIAGEYVKMVNEIKFLDDGTAVVWYRDFNIVDVVYGDFKFVWSAERNLAWVGDGVTEPIRQIDLDEVNQLNELDLAVPTTDGLLRQNFAAVDSFNASPPAPSLDLCSKGIFKKGTVLCDFVSGSAKLKVNQATVDFGFAFNGDVVLEAKIPKVTESYVCKGVEQRAPTGHQYCIDRFGVWATPTVTVTGDFDVDLEGEVAINVIPSGDLRDEWGTFGSGIAVPIGALPIKLRIVFPYYGGWQIKSSGTAKFTADFNYEKGMKVGFDYYSATNPEAPVDGQEWYLYPRDSEPRNSDGFTGNADVTGTIGISEELYFGIGVKFQVEPTPSGAFGLVTGIGGPGAGAELNLNVGGSSCGSTSSSGCSGQQFSDCGKGRIDIKFKSLLAINLFAQLGDLFEAKVGVGRIDEIIWNLREVDLGSNVNCAPGDGKKIRIVPESATEPQGQGTYADKIVIDHIWIFRRDSSGTPQYFRPNFRYSWGANTLRSLDIDRCNDVNGNGADIARGQVEVELGGSAFTTSQVIQVGDEIWMAPNAPDFQNDANNPCQPGGTFRLQIGDGSRWQDVRGANGQPILFRANQTNSHTVTNDDLLF